MTDKELRKLKREDFIEIIYQYQRREQKLLAENARLKAELADRYTRIENAGSIAEAALSLNHVLESVQTAADQYLEEIRTLRDQAARGELQIPYPELPELPQDTEEEGSRKWNLDEIGSLLSQSEQEQEMNPFMEQTPEEPEKPHKHHRLGKKPRKEKQMPPMMEDDGAYVPEEPRMSAEPQAPAVPQAPVVQSGPEAGYTPVTRPEEMTMEDIDLLLESLKDI